MTVESGLALIFASLVSASIPGPGVSAVVAQSLARGFKAGASFSFGIVLGDLVYILVALFGMGWIALAIGPWFALIKWAGAAYLIYLGVKYWRAKPPADHASFCEVTQKSGRTFLGGFCLTLGNPKAIAFYCGFLPTFVNIPELTGMDMVLVASLILPSVLGVLLTYSLLASKGRQAIRSTKLWKIANRTAGSVMIGAGLAVAAE